MTWRKDFLRDYREISNDFVELADRSVVPIEGIGKLGIPIINKKGETSIATFDEVLYVPQLKKNLLSGPMMTSKRERNSRLSTIMLKYSPMDQTSLWPI